MADGSAERVLDKVLARDAALLTDTVREAGALALSLFRTELKNWTKGASSPVPKPISPSTICWKSGCDPPRRITAGCRKKASTTNPVSKNLWYGSSTRSTARGDISPGARTGA